MDEVTTTLHVYREGAIVIQKRTLKCPEAGATAVDGRRHIEVRVGPVSNKIKDSSFSVFGSLETLIWHEIERRKKDCDSLTRSMLGHDVAVTTLRKSEDGAQTESVQRGVLLSAGGACIALRDDKDRLSLIQEPVVRLSSTAAVGSLPEYTDQTYVRAVVSTPCRNLDRTQLVMKKSMSEIIPNVIILNTLYDTDGMGWDISYEARLSDSDSSMSITGKLGITNHTGIEFRAAAVHVVNGTLSRVKPHTYQTQTRALLMAVPDSEPQQASDREYDTYPLPLRLDIRRSRNVQYINFFQKNGIPVERLYVLHTGESNAHIVIRWKNSVEKGVGILLPPGVYTVNRLTSSLDSELLGEVNPGSLPVGRRVEMDVGSVFSIRGHKKLIKESGEETRMEQPGKRFTVKQFQLTLSNDKPEAVSLTIRESMQALNWRVYDASYYVQGDQLTKKNFLFTAVKKRPNSNVEETRLAQAAIDVPAESSIVALYTVEYERSSIM